MNSVTEMAVAIQNGREDLIPTLWESIRGLVAFFAKRFYLLYECDRFGVEVVDLVQCGYFGLLNALRRYDPDGGASFTTYLYHWVFNSFQDAIGRHKRKRMDLLNNCSSLDVPLDDDDEICLYDCVPDDHDYIADVDHRIYLEQLRAALEKALSQINEQDADVLRGQYLDSKTLKDLADREGVSLERIRQRSANGLRSLRHNKQTQALRQFLDYYMPSRAGGIRPTESTVLYLDDIAKSVGRDLDHWNELRERIACK